MERILTEDGARRLSRRDPLPVDPAATIAVKRDVHELIVDTDAATFARAFREVLIDPGSTFGLIRVKRPAARVGQDFAVGERFQGCFSLERAALGRLPRRARGVASRLLASRPAAALLRLLEDALLSNYAEVVAIDDAPGPGQPYRIEYRYLDGTPIAGSSVFTIEELGDGRCRVRQVFEYQEVNAVALATFQRFGLKYHDQVVQREIEQAAARAGARVVAGTIPAAYGALS
jgi:hypothetical protein